MNTPARIVASIAVLAGVFVLGYVLGARSVADPAAGTETLPVSSPTAASSAAVPLTPTAGARVPVSPDPAGMGRPSPPAGSTEPVTATAPALPRPTKPYRHLSAEWIRAYGHAIRAVRNPELNPNGRELDETCLKVLEPMVIEGSQRLQIREEEQRKALETFMDWKESQQLFANSSATPGNKTGRRTRSAMRMVNGVTTNSLITVDPGESPEVDAAALALADEVARYEREVREFIATCGR